jgi:hypothetical protein
MTLSDTLRALLREPDSLVPADITPLDAQRLVPNVLLVLLGVSCALGAVVGSYRGGLQPLYSALKLPGVYLVPVFIGAPAVHAVVRSWDDDATWTRTAMAVLVGATRSALLAFATSPLLWIAWRTTILHFAAVRLVAVALLITGAPGLLTIARLASPTAAVSRATVFAAVVVGMLVGQTGWWLRPFVGHRDQPVAWSAPSTGHFLKGLAVPNVHPLPTDDALRPEGLDGSL